MLNPDMQPNAFHMNADLEETVIIKPPCSQTVFLACIIHSSVGPLVV